MKLQFQALKDIFEQMCKPPGITYQGGINQNTSEGRNLHVPNAEGHEKLFHVVLVVALSQLLCVDLMAAIVNIAGSETRKNKHLNEEKLEFSSCDFNNSVISK